MEIMKNRIRQQIADLARKTFLPSHSFTLLPFYLFTFLLFYLFTFTPLALSAQEADGSLRQIYEQAENDYQIGRLEQSLELLQSNLGHFSGNLRQSAYRLIALCYLGQDKMEETESYASLLLKENPYYNSVQDPTRFEDIVNRLKSGQSATITTASKLAESVEEAPVPVTLITEEMIRLSTARNLLELLADYVPGVNIVEGEEANFSMRGMYAYSQENVLIMLNGMRLNSYCTNSVAPDYRISLANIKQIEVLRGAASSLYGNVALNAVVNIITKDGGSVDGLKATVGGGNYNTYKADLLFGKQLVGTSILAWGSIYGSKGTRHDIAANDPTDAYGMIPADGYIYTNGYNGLPAYDLGVSLRWKHLDFQACHQYSKRVYTYNNLFFTSTYSYDKYATIDGVQPGRGVSSTNAQLKYSDSWKNFSLELGAKFNHESTMLYNMPGDTVPAFLSNVGGMLEWKDEYFNPDSIFMQSGLIQMQSWKNLNYGADVKGIYEYTTPRLGRGSLMMGLQYDYFDMYYNDFSLGDHYNRIIIKTANDRVTTFKNNHESNLSGFFQLKHQFGDYLIVNAGLRYDHKQRYTDTSKDVLSPRVALVWTPTTSMSYKLSYARSFVDAPYFYRVSSVIYQGNEDLAPQYLNNVQLSAMLTFPAIHSRWEANIFYNNVQDIINMSLGSYDNNGTVKTLGMEHVFSYATPGFKARATAYLQRVMELETYVGEGHSLYSVPNVTTHLQLSKQLIPGFWIIGKGIFTSEQKFMYVSGMTYRNGESLQGNIINLPATFLLDLGARYSWNWLEASVNCQNVLNHQYRLGGDRIPVLQQGTTLLATLSVHLTK